MGSFKFVDVEGYTNSEKMGNKELRDGCFSFNDGINLCKWSTVEVARVGSSLIPYE